MMIQIRSGHILLNAYLFRIKRADTDICQACANEEVNYQCIETVKHYLFECTKYIEQREALVKKISRCHPNLHDIVAENSRMTVLTHYISKTGLFKEK